LHICGGYKTVLYITNVAYDLRAKLKFLSSKIDWKYSKKSPTLY